MAASTDCREKAINSIQLTIKRTRPLEFQFMRQMATGSSGGSFSPWNALISFSSTDFTVS
ncbi:unnamed protein product [Penicillium camemberti]|uniref:Str. FM013 n=1 Tax=Penicillium camemberti (strain FM 013) TaxID=1429867 RepID=A0A0G4PV48_PENC3|nr:unnamed protein product [Penicillium camemberti]